jgi:hypothetical protein
VEVIRKNRERVKGKEWALAVLQEKKIKEHDWKKMKFSLAIS